MIEPVIDAFTTLVKFFESAISAMINSAALPKVAFNNPPTPWPAAERVRVVCPTF